MWPPCNFSFSYTPDDNEGDDDDDDDVDEEEKEEEEREGEGEEEGEDERSRPLVIFWFGTLAIHFWATRNFVGHENTISYVYCTSTDSMIQSPRSRHTCSVIFQRYNVH